MNPVNVPAVVRESAPRQAELAAAFAMFEESGKRRLEAAIRIGGILADRKKCVGHGNWLKWLEQHFPFGRERAADFIRVYLEHEKVGRAATFEEALRLLAPEPVRGRPATFAGGEPDGPDDDPPDADETPLAEPSDDPEPADEPAPPPPMTNALPQPSAPGPAGPPSWFTPGGKAVDPAHPFAEVLKRFTALSAMLTAELRKLPAEHPLVRALVEVGTREHRVPFLAFGSDVIEGVEARRGAVRFVGLYALRSLVRKWGDARRYTAGQPLKDFAGFLGEAEREGGDE